MRTFNILIKMPEDNEYFIAAWAAICTYEKKLRDMRVPFQTFILMKETWLSKYIIPPMTFVANEMEELEGISFDLVSDFSEERAFDIGKYGRTAADAYGKLIGLEQVNELISIKSSIPSKDITIIWWDAKSYKFFEKIQNKNTELIVAGYHESRADSWSGSSLKEKVIEENIEMVVDSKIIFSRRSVETYLAASANRQVLEIYPLDEYPKELFSKFNNPRYSVLYVENKNNIDQQYSLIWRALERMIRQLPKKVEANV